MMWRPHGVEAPDPARWDAHPERSTYFLQLLAKEKREGRLLQGNPNNAHYNLFIRSFWEKFHIYHTKSQFKNHFCTKKQLWNLLGWAQNCTGISWDHERKMVVASPEWWDANKERKGVPAIRDRPIPDYDLIELVFRGQHAEGLYLRDPTVPRFPAPGIAGDTLLSETVRSGDPGEDGSREREAQNRRRKNTTPPAGPSRKRSNMKNSDRNSSPVIDHMDAWFHKMEEMRARRQLSKTPDSGRNPVRSSRVSFMDALEILVEEMKLDGSSDLFQGAQEMFHKSHHMRQCLIKLPKEQRWPWLVKTLERRKAQLPPTPTKAPLLPTSDCASSG